MAKLDPLRRGYIERFMTEECREKAGGHDKAGCKCFHSSADRRRKLVYSKGKWNYYPIRCKTKDCAREDCPFSHNAFECDYHFLTYKTTMCKYPATEGKSGLCTLLGEKCPKSHGKPDLRSLVEFYLGKAEPLPPPRQQEEQKRRDIILSPASSQAFDIVNTYKTVRCPNPACADLHCQYYHNSLERRRADWRRYRPEMCSIVFVNNRYEPPSSCPRGDICEYCHTKNELYYHPQNYRKKLCTRQPCRYGRLCPDIHPDSASVPRPPREHTKRLDPAGRVQELYGAMLRLKVSFPVWHKSCRKIWIP